MKKTIGIMFIALLSILNCKIEDSPGEALAIISDNFPAARNDSEGDFTVTLNITGADTVSVDVNGNAPTVSPAGDDYTFTVEQVWLNYGGNTIYVTAADSSGNQTIEDYSVTRVDDLNPTISEFTRFNAAIHDFLVSKGGNPNNHLYPCLSYLAGKPTNPAVLLEYYLTFSTADNDQIVTPTTNIGSISDLGSGNYRVNFPEQAQGPYTLTVTVTDNSGNSVSRNYAYSVEQVDIE